VKDDRAWIEKKYSLEDAPFSFENLGTWTMQYIVEIPSENKTYILDNEYEGWSCENPPPTELREKLMCNGFEKEPKYIILPLE
jgi:hypothetical protein